MAVFSWRVHNLENLTSSWDQIVSWAVAFNLDLNRHQDGNWQAHNFGVSCVRGTVTDSGEVRITLIILDRALWRDWSERLLALLQRTKGKCVASVIEQNGICTVLFANDGDAKLLSLEQVLEAAKILSMPTTSGS